MKKLGAETDSKLRINPRTNPEIKGKGSLKIEKWFRRTAAAVMAGVVMFGVGCGDKGKAEKPSPNSPKTTRQSEDTVLAPNLETTLSPAESPIVNETYFPVMERPADYDKRLERAIEWYDQGSFINEDILKIIIDCNEGAPTNLLVLLKKLLMLTS